MLTFEFKTQEEFRSNLTFGFQRDYHKYYRNYDSDCYNYD